MNFYPALVEIESALTEIGFVVGIPYSAKEMKLTGDFDPVKYKGGRTYEERSKIIMKNFVAISHKDAILVINNTKNGVDGYIGPNVLMEIGVAFYLKKKIFIWNPVPQNAPYQEELNCFGVQVINRDLSQITI